MGDLYRSQDMSLIRIFMPTDTAKSVLNELGKLDVIHFRDLNPRVNAFQRNFVNEVKRVNELERKLAYFQAQLEKVPKFRLPQYKIEEEESIVIEDESNIEMLQFTPLETIESIEETFEHLENDLLQLSTYQTTLNERNFELLELQHVLLYLSPFFETDLDIEFGGEHDQLRFIVGTIDRKKVDSFERVIWRTLRGNMFFRNCEIAEDLISPFTGEYIEKNAFIIFYQGERVRDKLKKLSEAFGCSLFQFPTTQSQRDRLVEDTRNHIEDMKIVIEKSIFARDNLFLRIFKNFYKWKEFLNGEKAIFHAMNLFEYDFGRRCLVGEGWCPTLQIDEVRLALRTGSEKGGGRIHPIIEIVNTKLTPPTYHKTNSFTKPFQDIVDMYGIARYKEANPGVFTIITFPFLFGVMFGDVGHGLLLLLPSLYLLYVSRFSAQAEILKKKYEFRWLTFLMAIFAIYCGFMYNEFFSLPMAFFPTNWKYVHPIVRGDYAVQIDTNYCYPFGVDPLWKGAFNELDYYNSLKMKMSILLGVTQMLLGIAVSSTNWIYFNKKISFFFEFIPQILFLSSIFGYMSILIITKWLIQWPDSSAPRLLNLMIEMILSPWSLSPKYLIFNYQHVVQMGLIALAVVCVPWMLLSKPLILYVQNRLKNRKKIENFVGDIPLVEMNSSTDLPHDDHPPHLDHDHDDEDDDEEEFDFGEIFVHQCIHTIEFVLGCISNTASYLRLWALSLAHSELAAVFWERVLLQKGLETNNFFMIFATWAVWAVLTVGVLLGMESMSALLHALRLHWVEFQNKFYMADGYKFAPFSLKPKDDEDD